MSIGNCKLKQHDANKCLLGLLKFKILTIPNTEEGVEQQEPSFIAGGNAK